MSDSYNKNLKDELDIDFLDDNYDSNHSFYNDDKDKYSKYFTEDTNDKKKKNKKTQGKTTILSEIFSYVKIFAAAILISFLFTHFIIVNAEVPTSSMVPTIMEKDKLIGFRLSYLFSEPKRGDIVIFKFPDDESQKFIKRVIGVENDIIQIKNGQLYVNGELQNEDYIREPMKDTPYDQTFVVPAGHYFMMGDNRNYSHDSRYWNNTFVSKDQILAKAIFKYYDGENGKIKFSKFSN